MTTLHDRPAKTLLPFDALDRASLSIAGGKAANLGELTRAEFPVPAGFCVTTAAYDIVAGDAGLDSILGTRWPIHLPATRNACRS